MAKQPPRTLEDARAAFVDEVLRYELAARASTEQSALRRQIEAERRRATFHVVPR